jgi:hypothetical protein
MRFLIPLRLARLLVLGSAAFDDLTTDDLQKQILPAASRSSITATELQPGMVLGILTDSGKLVKMRIDSVGESLSVSWVSYPWVR